MSITTRQLKDRLRSLQGERATINPETRWTEKNRVLLLSEIVRTRHEEPTRTSVLAHVWEGLSVVFPPRLVYTVVRPALVMALVFAVASGGWITTVSAASGSLPGDAMHVVKVSLESAQIAMARLSGSTETVAKLEAERAVKRIEEARTLARTPVPVNSPEKKKAQQKNVQRAVVSAQKSLNNLNKELERAETQKPAQAISFVSAAAPAVEHVEDALEKAKVDIKAGVQAQENNPVPDTQKKEETAADDVVKVMTALERDVLVAQTKTAELMVKKYAEDQESVTAETVKQHLGDQIEKIENKVDGSSLLLTKKVEQVKKAQEEIASNEGKVQNKVDAGVVKTVEQIVAKTAAVTENVQETSVMVKETLIEAERLIKQDNFEGAAKKVAEARELASTAAQTANEIAAVAQTVENKLDAGKKESEEIAAVLPALEELVATSSPTPAPGLLLIDTPPASANPGS